MDTLSFIEELGAATGLAGGLINGVTPVGFFGRKRDHGLCFSFVGDDEYPAGMNDLLDCSMKGNFTRRGYCLSIQSGKHEAARQKYADETSFHDFSFLSLWRWRAIFCA